MASKYLQIDLQDVKTISIAARQNKVNRDDFALLPQGDFSILNFINCLPHQLAANDFRSIVRLIKRAHTLGKPIIWMIGAHVIKTGLSPLLIELMKTGFISTIAMNGAGAIHDSELAQGHGTSEDVEKNLADGSFGMAKETGEFLNKVTLEAKTKKLGFGEALGQRLLSQVNRAKEVSLFATAYELNIPATVHVAIGTDIVHQQPTANGAAIGDASFRDFKILTSVITKLDSGGVVLNVGSNVLLPEVFLKALTIARNVGHSVKDFTTANFDMIQHYRPRMNVVQRPVKTGGQGFSFTGHHELMIPLLAWSLLSDIV